MYGARRTTSGVGFLLPTTQVPGIEVGLAGQSLYPLSHLCRLLQFLFILFVYSLPFFSLSFVLIFGVVVVVVV